MPELLQHQYSQGEGLDCASRQPRLLGKGSATPETGCDSVVCFFLQERAGLMRNFFDLVTDNQEELASIMSLEMVWGWKEREEREERRDGVRESSRGK